MSPKQGAYSLAELVFSVVLSCASAIAIAVAFERLSRPPHVGVTIFLVGACGVAGALMALMYCGWRKGNRCRVFVLVAGWGLGCILGALSAACVGCIYILSQRANQELERKAQLTLASIESEQRRYKLSTAMYAGQISSLKLSQNDVEFLNGTAYSFSVYLNPAFHDRYVVVAMPKDSGSDCRVFVLVETGEVWTKAQPLFTRPETLVSDRNWSASGWEFLRSVYPSVCPVLGDVTAPPPAPPSDRPPPTPVTGQRPAPPSGPQ